MRAISRFASFSRALFSRAPVADWKRRLNSSCRRSANASASSSSVMSLRSLALKEVRLPLHELRLQRQLRPGQAERFLRQRLRHAGELEHHTSGLDHRDPVLRRALARAHAGLGRLFGRRLGVEYVDPHLPASLDLARHRNSRGLDLPVGDPAGLERLQAVVAELHGRLALGEAAPAAALVLAELRLLGQEHLVVRLLRRRVAGLVELGRVLLLGLGRGRVGGIRDRCRGRLDLRLDLRLLAALGRLRLLVGAWPLDVVLAARAVTGSPAPARRAATAALPAPAAPRRAHRAEALAVALAVAPALAGGAEALDVRAAAARLILLAEPHVLLGVDAAVTLRHDLALVDPDLHADPAEGRLRLDEAVVDVRTDRVQRDASLGVGLRPAHLGAAEAAAALDADALRTGADARRERALHRSTEAHAVLQLLGDRLRDELRIELGTLDLVDVDVDVLLGDRVQLFAQRVDLDARLADHDPGARRVDVDRDPLLVLADQDVGQPGVRQLVGDVLPDLDVLDQVLRELLLARVPVRLPVVDDADAHPAGMNFLTH